MKQHRYVLSQNLSTTSTPEELTERESVVFLLLKTVFKNTPANRSSNWPLYFHCSVHIYKSHLPLVIIPYFYCFSLLEIKKTKSII